MKITELYERVKKAEEWERETLEEVINILEENEIESVEQIIVTGIKWDAPKSAGLPKRVVIDVTLDNVELLEDFNGYADNLSDYLSDTYGYCHEGFNAKYK